MSLTFSRLSLPQKLKEETHDLHLQSEALIQPRLAQLNSLDEYASVLLIFYGFFYPMQLQVLPHITAEVLEDSAERCHAALIIDDLQAIGRMNGELPLCGSLPRTDNTAQALGALYVMEGSTLGGRYIRKMLLSHPHLQLQPHQVQFFNGYGEETGPKWKTFQSALNRYDQDGPEVIDAARRTFTAFTTWIQQNVSA